MVCRVLPIWASIVGATSLGVPLLTLHLCHDFSIDSWYTIFSLRLSLEEQHPDRRYPFDEYWAVSIVPLQSWLSPHFNTRLQHTFYEIFKLKEEDYTTPSVTLAVDSNHTHLQHRSETVQCYACLRLDNFIMSLMVSETGLEPVTSRLSAVCSAN